MGGARLRRGEEVEGTKNFKEPGIKTPVTDRSVKMLKLKRKTKRWKLSKSQIRKPLTFRGAGCGKREGIAKGGNAKYLTKKNSNKSHSSGVNIVDGVLNKEHFVKMTQASRPRGLL